MAEPPSDPAAPNYHTPDCGNGIFRGQGDVKPNRARHPHWSEDPAIWREKASQSIALIRRAYRFDGAVGRIGLRSTIVLAVVAA
jgi:hypothetical protein